MTSLCGINTYNIKNLNPIILIIKLFYCADKTKFTFICFSILYNNACTMIEDTYTTQDKRTTGYCTIDRYTCGHNIQIIATSFIITQNALSSTHSNY